MKRLVSIITAMAVSLMVVGVAGADGIKGRLGLSGKAGFSVASDSKLSDSSSTKLVTDGGFAGGGGLIFGITDILAVEADVT